MGRTANDDRSDSLNPNNQAYYDNQDNHSNQMNPNNSAYFSSRGLQSDDEYDNGSENYVPPAPAYEPIGPHKKSEDKKTISLRCQPIMTYYYLDYISCKDGNKRSARLDFDNVEIVIDELAQSLDAGRLWYVCLKDSEKLIFEKTVPPQNTEAQSKAITLAYQLSKEMSAQETSISNIESNLAELLLKNHFSYNKENLIRLLREHSANLMALKNMYQKIFDNNPEIKQALKNSDLKKIASQATAESNFFKSFSSLKSPIPAFEKVCDLEPPHIKSKDIKNL